MALSVGPKGVKVGLVGLVGLDPMVLGLRAVLGDGPG